MAKFAPNFTPMRRSEQRTSSRELLEYLRSDDKLGSLLPTVEQVVQLQAACEQQLPSLFNSCQVMQLREGTLHISAPNAALATRLRQVLPKLQQGLRERLGCGADPAQGTADANAACATTAICTTRVIE